jgi:peptide/nickel transport system substrate-binding protein
LAKKLVAESGYKGEEVLIMSPTDQPILQATCQVVADMLKKVGIKVKYGSMDWGTLVARRASREPSANGGWDIFCTTWAGLATASPGSSQPLRGIGKDSWFGWPTSPRIEALRDQWFDAPSLEAQQKLSQQIQVQAIEEVPFLPTGMFFTPTAYRSSITGLIKSGTALMYGVKPV